MSRVLPALGFALLLSACEPPIPILAKLSAPVLSAQRRMGQRLLVVLSYDTKKTPCGAVNFLRATLDGIAMEGSAGQRIVNADGSETCEFPNYSLEVNNGTTPREIVVTDDVTAVSMTLDTINVGNANPESPPATLRPGYVLRWNAVPPSAGTSSWNVIFTPEGGTAVTWGEGTNLPSSFSVTVPAVTSAASGTVAATWLVNTVVTKCEGAGSCSATIQGAGSFLAVVAP
ncbi:MAG: hypothetical protein Q8L48_10725 [Archangium sp.]|nr:hypothetical protein [Archangium sp.]